MSFDTIISTIGVSLILIAFFLSTFELLKSTTKLFYMLNIIGGGFACYGSFLLHSVPFTILEGTWCLVALVGLFKAYLKK
jgi:hypothetical protein